MAALSGGAEAPGFEPQCPSPGQSTSMAIFHSVFSGICLDDGSRTSPRRSYPNDVCPTPKGSIMPRLKVDPQCPNWVGSLGD
jgi:hypothetical protein